MASVYIVDLNGHNNYTNYPRIMLMSQTPDFKACLIETDARNMSHSGEINAGPLLSIHNGSVDMPERIPKVEMSSTEL